LHDVATITACGRPGECVFGGLRAAEEVGAEAKCAGDCCRVDAVVGEVDEAGVLEAVENRGGGGFALLGCAG